MLSSNSLLSHTWVNLSFANWHDSMQYHQIWRIQRQGNLQLILEKYFLILYTGNTSFFLHFFPPPLQQYQTKSHITLGHQCYKYGTVGKCHYYLSSCFYWLGFYRYLCSSRWVMLALWYTVILLIKRTKRTLQVFIREASFKQIVLQ